MIQRTVYKRLLDSRAGLRDCLEYLKKNKNYLWSNIIPINEGRYFIVKGSPNIAIVFKTVWFLKFGDMGFINEEGQTETGLGETLNVDDLKRMLSEGVTEIYTVYQDGRIYHISMFDCISKSHRWTNKEGKEVRSFSIHHLVRLN
jgi:hypothetical protein